MRHLILGLFLVLAARGSAQPPAPADPLARASDSGEPWTITGGSLEGSQEGETRLRDPRAQQGSATVTAREGIWRRAEEILVLIGDVVLREGGREVKADSATYRRAEGLAILTGRVRGRDAAGDFTAHELWYWRSPGRIVLRDSAVVHESGRVLHAREVTYRLADSAAVAVGDVVLLDPAESTRVTGQRCELDRLHDVIVMTGSPELRRTGTGLDPDLWLRSDTLVFRRAEGAGEARGNVHLTRGSVDARSGRADFDLEKDLLLLTEGPVAEDPDGRVTGDSMAVVMRSGRAERLEVLGSALLEYRPQAKPGEVDFVTGDTLVARIDSIGVRAIEVRGRARSLYIPAPANRAEGVGSNLARGDRIVLGLADGEAQQVDLSGGATGEYVLPREKPDTTRARLPDSLYVARAKEFFLANPDEPLPDSLEALGPFDPAERVSYAGEKVTFLVPDRRIEIRTSGKVDYQNLSLESDEIDYDARRDRVTALGKPVLADRESELHGQRMVYRLDRRQGFVYQGKTEFEGGFYSGEEIKRVDSKILLVKGGDYTTCDADTSHYHFHSSRMKIRMGDKVIARPIVLYLQDIPLLALPYWVFPIKRGRHSGILMPDVEFGFDQTRGRFVRNLGYYWAPNDYGDAMLWGDYYENNPRWIVNSQVRYKLRYKLHGEFFTSYSRQDIAGERSTRWDLRGGHQHELGEDLTLSLRADFVSDKDYRDDRDFGGSVDERLNQTLKSNVNLRKNWGGTTLTVAADRTESLAQESGSTEQIRQNLPFVDLSVGSFTIGQEADKFGRGERLPFLKSMRGSVGFAFRSTFVKPWGEKTKDNQAARVTSALSDTRSVLGILNLTPSFSTTGAYFRRDTQGESHQTGAVWSTGARAASTLYGTVLPNWGRWTGVRHVVEPAVSYNYSPEFRSLQTVNDEGFKVQRFPSVGGISLSGQKVNSMSLSLTQRVHLKLRGSDPKKPIKIDNLINWTTSASCNLLQQGTRKRWTNISNNLRFNPSRYFENSWTVTHDPVKWRPQGLSAQTYLRLSGGGGKGASADTTAPAQTEYGAFGQAGTGNRGPGESGIVTGGPWTLNVSHSYSRSLGGSNESSRLNFSTTLNPTAHWQVGGSLYYDLREHETVSHSYWLHRDLHCWEFRFENRFNGGSAEYSFRINVKALPDVQYERQRR